MNPNETIKLWLLTAAEPFHITEAHDDSWDAADQNSAPYFTYFLEDGTEIQDGSHKKTTAVGNDADYKITKSYMIRVRVDLYRSQAGLNELCSIAAAANNPMIMRIFKSQDVAFKRATLIKNVTPRGIPEGERGEHYHQYMMCEFHEKVTSTLRDTNAIVTKITTQISRDHTSHDITKGGVVLTPAP